MKSRKSVRLAERIAKVEAKIKRTNARVAHWIARGFELEMTRSELYRELFEEQERILANARH